VNRGWDTLTLALQEEHSAGFTPHLARAVEAVERWKRTATGADSHPG
jgi:hypothetical protein